MNKTVKFWLENLYRDAIEKARGTISNEHLWELGYDGEEPNPHSGNIVLLHEYIDVLEEKLSELR